MEGHKSFLRLTLIPYAVELTVHVMALAARCNVAGI